MHSPFANGDTIIADDLEKANLFNISFTNQTKISDDNRTVPPLDDIDAHSNLSTI